MAEQNPHDVEDVTPDEFHAALFMRLGRESKFSRSGYSIVFADPADGRADLSDYRPQALLQLQAAGIDPGRVTAADVAAYRGWRDGLYHARRIAQARFLVSRQFGLEWGGGLVPANRVSLIDGWGNPVAERVLHQQQYRDPNGTPQIGAPGSGAYAYRVDTGAVLGTIALLRNLHPEFGSAPVQDNNNPR